MTAPMGVRSLSRVLSVLPVLCRQNRGNYLDSLRLRLLLFLLYFVPSLYPKCCRPVDSGRRGRRPVASAFSKALNRDATPWLHTTCRTQS